jgi:hypothetical protein
MRRSVYTVFNEYITTAAPPVNFTSSGLNDMLGSLDALGFEVVVDNSTGTATFDVWLDHSGDGRLWLPARSLPNQTPPFYGTGTGDVTGTITAGTIVAKFYSDCIRGVSKATPTATAHGPLLRFVRLTVALSAGSAHVKIHIFQRDT